MAKKKKMDFGGLAKTTKKVKQEHVYATQSVQEAKSSTKVGESPKTASQGQINVQKAPVKMGRPTWKDEKTKYVRVSVDVPKETRDRMKAVLYTKLKDDYLCQDHMINIAIEEFLTKHKG